MKAEFKLSITRNKMFKSSFSNVPLNYTLLINDTDFETDYFTKSTPISTYFISIIISNLQTININSTKYNSQIELIYNRLVLTNEQLKYSLDQAISIIDFISDFTNLLYPFKKTRILYDNINYLILLNCSF